MTFENFVINVVKENILKYLPRYNSDTVSIQTIMTKNNGIQKIALSVLAEDVSSLIYMEPFYEEYLSGKASSEVMKKIANIIEDTRESFIDLDNDIKKFFNFDKIKDKVIYQIVNAERYKELLSSCPHRIIADLAVIYHVMFQVDSKDDIVSCLISDKHLKIWNIDENELFLKAMENTPKLFPIQCCSILDVIENASEERRNEKVDMLLGVPFVLRNQLQCNGAAVVLYPGVFEEMQKKFGNFFLLPSSVHEWIIIPKWCGTDVKYMSSTVQEVNDTKVHPMEYLSGNIYTRGKDELLGIVKVY